MSVRDLVTELAAIAGITINGSNPYDIAVHDARFFARVARDGSLGLGESYMDGWWDSEDLAELHRRIAAADLSSHLRGNTRLLLKGLAAKWFNLQKPSRAYVVADQHYNLTVKAYRCMSDPYITLSCGYWKESNNLDLAQEAKLDLICRKLGLNAAHHVLDVGCGFGSFARFAAKNYGCRVTAINVAAEQIEVARDLSDGLPVNYVLCDYREVTKRFGEGSFDHVVSAGMFEHVGGQNYRRYMEELCNVLKPCGLFLLHTIGSNVSVHQNDPWFDRYIFPNGMLPSIAQIGKSIERLFVMEDWHNFGYDYFLTLMAWCENFKRNWDGPRDDPFFRMWMYYLTCSAGQFLARRVQLWHLVLAKSGVPAGYQTVR